MTGHLGGRQTSLVALVGLVLVMVVGQLAASAVPVSPAEQELEKAALQAAGQPDSEESYQRVYEAFARLMGSVSNNSLGNMRRLVQRLDQLVGRPTEKRQQELEPAPITKEQPSGAPISQSQLDSNTEQILERLDRVNGQTDGHTINKLSEDIGRLVGSLNDAYLRNVRRLIERVNRLVGPAPQSALHQAQVDDPGNRQPGFPGWDEVIVAVDRIQKSLAHFVRSTTRLVTSG